MGHMERLELDVFLDGAIGEIDVSKLLDFWTETGRLVRDAAQAAGWKRDSIVFRLADLRSGSADISMIIDAPATGGTTDSDLATVVAKAVQTLDAVAQGRRPAGTKRPTLTRAKKMAALLDTGSLGSARLTVAQRNGGPPDVLATTTLDADAGGNIERLLAEGWTSLGSVIGVMDRYDHHDKAVAKLHDEQSGATVEVHFPEDLRDDVHGLLDKRVLVWGVKHRDPEGHPHRLDLRHIEAEPRLTPRDIPTTTDILGVDPNFTHGMTAEEWVRAGRD